MILCAMLFSVLAAAQNRTEEKVTVDSLVRNVAAYSGAGTPKQHMFGLVRVNDKGQITLTKKCREVFGIEPQDTLLMLGDEDKGIALVKISEP